MMNVRSLANKVCEIENVFDRFDETWLDKYTPDNLLDIVYIDLIEHQMNSQEQKPSEVAVYVYTLEISSQSISPY